MRWHWQLADRPEFLFDADRILELDMSAKWDVSVALCHPSRHSRHCEALERFYKRDIG